MRVGDTCHPSTAELLVGFSRGVIRTSHIRCGKIVIRKQANGDWLITEVERPDPEKRKAKSRPPSKAKRSKTNAT